VSCAAWQTRSAGRSSALSRLQENRDSMKTQAEPCDRLRSHGARSRRLVCRRRKSKERPAARRRDFLGRL